MSTQTDKAKIILKQLGFTSDEIEIYLLLLKQQELSALQISKLANLGRTKVYRILEKLEKENLVIVNINNRGKLFVSNSVQNLDLLISKKEIELKSLKQSVQEFYQSVEQVAKTHGKSKIYYYQGLQGLEQITWNTTKSSEELRIYEIETMSVFLAQDFSEKVRLEMVRNNIQTKQITNLKLINEYTNINGHTDNWEIKFIDRNILDIQIETLVYDDTFATYAPIGDEIFGVEIVNKDMARMQKQIFDIVWQQAIAMTIYNNKGKAVLRKS